MLRVFFPFGNMKYRKKIQKYYCTNLFRPILCKHFIYN